MTQPCSRPLAAALVLTAAGCATPPARSPEIPLTDEPRNNPMLAAHAPTFARERFGAFGRADAVAIALQEWRLFGQPVDDDPPDTRPEPEPEQKPERWAGLGQR